MGDEDLKPSGRRFLHRSRVNRGKKGGKDGEKGDSFQPRNMLGRYSIRSSAPQVLFHKHDLGPDAEPEMWLEIHELVESKTGFLATFDLGFVNGVMLIAGSRKALRNVVDEMENDGDDDDDEDGSEDELTVSDTEAAEAAEESNAEQNLESEDAKIDNFERPPELDRPTHAFEKNTFRTPKWFAQWRGQVKGRDDRNHDTADGEDPISDGMNTSTDRDNKAHFEFTSSACREFSATFSCPELELKDVAMQGWKITNKASKALRKWSDFDST